MYRAAAMLGAVLCTTALPSLAQPNPSPAASRELRAGARLTFVSDDTIDVRTVRPGGRFRLHLADNLLLGSTILAPAGTPARLVVLEKIHAPDGRDTLRVAIAAFRLPAGELPVVPIDDRLDAVAPGTAVPAKTAGRVEAIGEHVVIRVPPPFALPNDEPVPYFTPIPVRTPMPRPSPARRGAARPSPSPSPDATPTP